MSIPVPPRDCDALRRRDFDSAISIMEAVRSGGHRSRYDALSYNLGKAYLARGQPGAALAVRREPERRQVRLGR